MLATGIRKLYKTYLLDTINEVYKSMRSISLDEGHKEIQECYCGRPLDSDAAFSEWDNRHQNHHYKVIICSCGKKNRIKAAFDGSGHDKTLSRVKESKKSLESAIRKVMEGDKTRS